MTDNVVKKETSRIAFLDVAKGIGILLVVWYHTDLSPHLFNLFFMPLFFLISGMFLNTAPEARKFFSKQFHRLMLPLFFGMTAGLILELTVYHGYEMQKSLNEKFYNFWLVGNVPLWFLLALFYVTTIVYVVENYVKRDWLKWAVYVALSLAGYVLSRLGAINTLFVGQAFLSLPYFVAGYKWRDMWLSKRWMNWFVLAACCVIVAVLFYFKLPDLNVHRLIISKDYVSSVLMAFAMVTLVLAASVWISRTNLRNFFVWFGESSLFILVLHDLTMHPIIRLGNLFFDGEKTVVSMLTTFTVALIVSTACVLVGKRLKKWMPRYW